MRPTHSARTGMALILTLATIVLGGALALLMQARGARVAQAEQAELIQERLRIAAAEAARDALWVLAADDNLNVDHAGEDWAQPREHTFPDGLATWAVVEDAGRFFNWNNLAAAQQPGRTSRDICGDLLTFCGDFQALPIVAALSDYVDSDDTGDYEEKFYRHATPPLQPPNRELWAPGELLNVHGFTARFLRPRPKADSSDMFSGDIATAAVVVPVALTQPIPINLNTASREVLMALAGLQHEDAVRSVLALRMVQPFESLGALLMAHPELAAKLGDSVRVNSVYFRVRARAALGDQFSTVLAWVERDSHSGDIRILQWVPEVG